MWDRGPASLVCMWISSCSKTICWKDCSFPLNCFGALVKNQLTVNVTVYFWSLHCIPLSVCLYLGQYQTVFSTLVCSKLWNWEVSVFLLFFLFFKIVWLFWDPCTFMWILGSTCPFSLSFLVFFSLAIPIFPIPWMVVQILATAGGRVRDCVTMSKLLQLSVQWNE